MEAKGESKAVHFIVDRRQSHQKQGTDETFKTTPTMTLSSNSASSFSSPLGLELTKELCHC